MTCRHCTAEFRIAGNALTPDGLSAQTAGRIRKHEEWCATATPFQRRIWKLKRRKPGTSPAERERMLARQRLLRDNGLCLTCKAETEINPKTGRKYSRCSECRDDHAGYSREYRKEAA